MCPSPAPTTNPTLLGRLRACPTDQEAWTQFVAQYGPTIHAWALRRCRSLTDADEVTQETFKKLASALRTFQYEPAGSFRAWLKKVVHSVTIDAFHNQVLSDPATGRRPECDDEPPAPAELARLLAEKFDLELLAIAEIRVQARLNRETWLAYEWSTKTPRSNEDIARALGMTVDNVYLARFRALAALKEEVQKLDRWSADDQPRLPRP